MKLSKLESYLNTLLKVNDIKNDFCPNGLQVHGRDEVKKIAVGVSASLEFIEKAIKLDFDTLIVHHGLFWNYQDRTLTKLQRRRVEALIKNDINLFAYHLPLDVHHTLGNNSSLLKHLGYDVTSNRGENLGIAICDNLPDGLTFGDLYNNIALKLKREPLITHSELNREIKKIAVCTGSAGIYFESLLYQDIDAYITGEISEQHWHMARESGTIYIAAGHTATETYGPINLGEHLQSTFPRTDDVDGLDVLFIDIFNPI